MPVRMPEAAPIKTATYIAKLFGTTTENAAKSLLTTAEGLDDAAEKCQQAVEKGKRTFRGYPATAEMVQWFRNRAKDYRAAAEVR